MQELVNYKLKCDAKSIYTQGVQAYFFAYH
jgi:hypothetical protein